MTNVVRPWRSAFRPSWIIASLSLSRLDVASSRMRIRGSARIARAIATRCRWPPDRPDLVARCVRPGIRDVRRDRPVEEEIVLQHDAEVRAIIAQLDRGEVVA